jgi:hypothetical protein
MCHGCRAGGATGGVVPIRISRLHQSAILRREGAASYRRLKEGVLDDPVHVRLDSGVVVRGALELWPERHGLEAVRVHGSERDVVELAVDVGTPDRVPVLLREVPEAHGVVRLAPWLGSSVSFAGDR